MKAFKAIFTFIIILTLFAIVAWAGNQRQEKFECLTWNNQSEEYSHFFVTQWQADQCMNYGYDLRDLIK